MVITIPFIKRVQESHIIPTIVKDMKEGFIYVLKQPFILKSMLLAALLNLILTPLFVVGAQLLYESQWKVATRYMELEWD